MKTISLFGHRNLALYDIKDRLKSELEKHLIEPVNFLIGTHGDFDSLALSVCRELRREFSNIEITIVYTSLAVLNIRSSIYSKQYKDINTMFFDIEGEHFKNRIVVSNKLMVDRCDIVICFVDMENTKSGARRAIKYALKTNKPVINLFNNEDRPYWGMSRDEVMKDWEDKKRLWRIGEK